MSDAALLALAEAAGLLPNWEDAFGTQQDVAPETLRRVLAALDLPAGTDAEIAESHAHLRQLRRETLAPLVTAEAGKPITLPIEPDRFEIVLEDGARLDGHGTGARRPRAAARDRPARLPPSRHRRPGGDARRRARRLLQPRRRGAGAQALGAARRSSTA